MKEKKEEFMAALHSVNFGIAKMMFRLVAPFKVSPPQARILSTLASLGGAATVSELARASQMPDSNASNICTRLSGLNYVERVKQSKDGREVTIRLTSEGESRYAEMKSALARVRVAALKDLSDEETEKATALLKKIDESLKRENLR